MREDFKEKELSEYFIVRCKECNNYFTDKISRDYLEKILIKDKEFYALNISLFRFYLFSGKNKMYNLSKESFLYDEVSCINCRKKFGKIIKSCREQFIKYINDYFIFKETKVVLENVLCNHVNQIKNKPVSYLNFQSLNKELDKLLNISEKFSINFEKFKEECNTYIDYYLVTKKYFEERFNQLEKNDIDKNHLDKQKENKENLDKTTAIIRFSADKFDNSLQYTEIKKKNENKLSFRIKNCSKEEEFNAKRKKF